MAEGFHSLAFAADEAQSDGLSQAFPLLYTGSFKRGDFGEIKVTQADLDRAVENFNSATKDEQGAPEIPVDFDHSFSKGQGSKAAGWIKALAREGDKLLARVKWTPEAAQAISAHQYRYISPEFTTNWKDEGGKERGFALLAAGATNRPFLKGLPPVALSDEVAAELREQATSLAQAGGLDLSGAPAGDPAANVRKTPAMAAEPTKTFTEEQVTALIDEKVAALSDKVTALEESRDQAVASLDETKAALRKEQVDKLLAQARREGRITADEATTTKWHERAEKHGVEFVRDLLGEFQADTIPMSERGSGHDKPLAGNAPDGVDQEHFELDQKIKAYAAEKGIPYSEAAEAIAF